MLLELLDYWTQGMSFLLAKEIKLYYSFVRYGFAQYGNLFRVELTNKGLFELNRADG